jgi:hypothetical protein
VAACTSATPGAPPEQPAEIHSNDEVKTEWKKARAVRLDTVM